MHGTNASACSPKPKPQTRNYDLEAWQLSNPRCRRILALRASFQRVAAGHGHQQTRHALRLCSMTILNEMLTGAFQSNSQTSHSSCTSRPQLTDRFVELSNGRAPSKQLNAVSKHKTRHCFLEGQTWQSESAELTTATAVATICNSCKPLLSVLLKLRSVHRNNRSFLASNFRT